MKKIILGLVAIFALAACSHDSGSYTVNQEAKVTNDYNTAFVKTFGQPAANQDWGFASRQLPASFFKATTRVANVNGNQWGTGDYVNYPQPNPITTDELNAVLEVFNQKGKETYEPLVDYRNFFVQQVYTGNATYVAGNGETVTGSAKMNRLFCTTKYKQTSYWPVEFTEQANYEPDYVNNSNNGNITAYDGCTLMLMSSTTNWSYESSQGGSHTFYYWRMEKINGNYYVGFDFASVRQASANSNEQVNRDLIYNDWIIKIVPGKGETTPDPKTYSVRIICEDLMATGGSDFDFNDVVFDVNYTENVNKTSITIKAAGGTIPLYIQGKEVHKLFQDAYPEAGIVLPSDGVLGTMINTNATGGVQVGDVSLELEGIIAPKDITITVNANGTVIPLKAETGEPAAKIAVDPSFEWLNERDNITQVCPNFPTYVKNGEINWY